jgi:hypothetical protein
VGFCYSGDKLSGCRIICVYVTVNWLTFLLIIRLFHDDVLTTDVRSSRIIMDDELKLVWEEVISYV